MTRASLGELVAQQREGAADIFGQRDFAPPTSPRSSESTISVVEVEGGNGAVGAERFDRAAHQRARLKPQALDDPRSTGDPQAP